MSNNPVFPMTDTHHFSDYGFHPHFDYFQVLEAAKKHKRENQGVGKAIDGLHFKLQKPTVSHELDYSKIIKKNKHNHKIHVKKRWWKKALKIFTRKWIGRNSQDHRQQGAVHPNEQPVYITESRSGSGTPYRTTSRPISGSLSPAMSCEMENLTYISLRDINNELQHRTTASPTMPIYLVT
ncbi:putative Toxicos en levadura 2 [Heracleum sosnowskyi]|uniref:Toxicos en levadura 2 n=1 Tax=Heracleum sosnowskyi TaxID=360622 RepID=A0AAD8IKQ4_9APIA|nr:putative Toxicos en levadura 2 [Heracleum sosnowskyi]